MRDQLGTMLIELVLEPTRGISPPKRRGQTSSGHTAADASAKLAMS